MAHLVPYQRSDQWVVGAPVPSAALALIDANTNKAIDGDGGGVWSPTNPIIIAGEGLGASGPFQLVAGASVHTNGTTNRFIFGKNTTDDAFVYGAHHADVSPTLLQPISISNTYPQRSTAIQAMLVPGGPPWIRALAVGARFWSTMRVHDGATLTNVEMRFIVRKVRTGLPAPEKPIRMRVVRMATDGTVEALRDGVTVDADGFMTCPITPLVGQSLGDAWFFNGRVQTFTYQPTRFNLIDLSKYVYLAEIIEESGNLGPSLGIYNPPNNDFISLLTYHSGVQVLASRR